MKMLKNEKVSSDLTIVFDVDDTICTTRDRDYKNSIPNFKVINKINHLKNNLGYYVILYTSRGMVSCGGNLEKIIEKNKEVLENWLKENNICYDELVFGKPLGDMYVDDKCMNVDDFIKSEFCQLKGGGSNKPLDRIGYLVKKDLGSKEEFEKLINWVEDNGGLCLYPKIVSKLYYSVYIEYLKGRNLAQGLCIADLSKILNIILTFKENKRDKFDMSSHISILLKNKGYDKDIDVRINDCIKELDFIEDIMNDNASYCHGDMILSNVMKVFSNDLYFIDPQYNRESSSYLLDLAKLRMSLCGYENVFGLGNIPKQELKKMLEFFDYYVEKVFKIKRVVQTLQAMYILRLTRYKKAEDCKKIIEMHDEVFNDGK